MKMTFMALMSILILLFSGCSDKKEDRLVVSGSETEKPVNNTTSGKNVLRDQPKQSENSIPVAKAQVSKNIINAGESATFASKGSMDGDGQIVAYKWQNKDGKLLSREASFTRVFPEPGKYEIILTVTDDKGAKSNARIKLFVKERMNRVTNEPPIANAYLTVAHTYLKKRRIFTDENASFSAEKSKDKDGKIVSYVWKNAEGKALSTNASFKKNFPYAGQYKITLTVTDNSGASSSDMVELLVYDRPPYNRAPIGVNDTTQTEWGKTVNILVLANDTDADGDTLSVTESPSAPAHGTAVVNADGKTIDYTPNPGFYGTDTFTYRPNDGKTNGSAATVSVMVNKVCHPPLKTGQTTSYTDFDDGYYQKGTDRSYTRDDAKEVVIDNTTGLMWQDDAEAKTVSKNRQDAKAYCQALTLGGYTDWRLPTIRELKSIVDRGRYKPATDLVFQNVENYGYWSSTPDASGSGEIWGINFINGYTHLEGPWISTHHIRCVRSVDD